LKIIHLLNKRLSSPVSILKINNRYHLINQNNFLICIKYEYNQYTILLKRKKLIFANFQINNFFSHTVTEVPVPNEGVQGVSILPATTIFGLDIGIVPTVVFFVFYLDGSHIILVY